MFCGGLGLGYKVQHLCSVYAFRLFWGLGLGLRNFERIPVLQWGNIWEFPKIRVPYFGVLIIRILLFRVPY